MTSWRETTSQQAQADLDQLLNIALNLAERQLASNGAFYPFAAAIDTDGQPHLIATRTSDDEHPQPTDIAAACFGALSDQRATIRAGAVATDVRMNGGGDAIRVDAEHAEGIALTALEPYTKQPPSGDIEFGELRAQDGQRQIWP